VAGETRAQMISTAARLFQRDGYDATSWRGLVEEAGTPWGSIHHHFPGGKEELCLATVQAGADAVAALIEHCFRDRRDPVAAVETWFALSSQLLTQSEYTAGCPVATVALETAARSERMRHAARQAFERWQRLLAAELRSAGVPRAAAADTAEAVLALLEGGLLLARVKADPGPMHTAARQAQAAVRAALGWASGSIREQL